MDKKYTAEELRLLDFFAAATIQGIYADGGSANKFMLINAKVAFSQAAFMLNEHKKLENEVK